jgi:hypothetical protein
MLWNMMDVVMSSDGDESHAEKGPTTYQIVGDEQLNVSPTKGCSSRLES